MNGQRLTVEITPRHGAVHFQLLVDGTPQCRASVTQGQQGRAHSPGLAEEIAVTFERHTTMTFLP